MSQDGRGFTVTVTVRSSTLSTLIDTAYILGAMTAEWLAPRPAVLPLTITLTTVFLVWSLGPLLILHHRRKRSGKPEDAR